MTRLAGWPDLQCWPTGCTSPSGWSSSCLCCPQPEKKTYVYSTYSTYSVKYKSFTIINLAPFSASHTLSWTTIHVHEVLAPDKHDIELLIHCGNVLFFKYIYAEMLFVTSKKKIYIIYRKSFLSLSTLGKWIRHLGHTVHPILKILQKWFCLN